MKRSKLLSTVALSLMLVMSFTIMASALEHRESESGNVFQSSWEKTWENGGRGQKLVYGFNTTWYDEDYCSTYSPSGAHTAIVSAGGVADSESAAKGSWTKDAQVRHAAGTVVWSMIY